MKSLKKVFVLFLTTMFICGCSMKSEFSMNIKSDKSMDFSVLMAVDDKLMNAMMSMQNSSEDEQSKEYTEEEKWKFLESSISEQYSSEGFEKERYEQDEYKGIKLSKKISNIDDITGDTINFSFENYANIDKSIVFVKNGDKYKATLTSEGLVNVGSENSGDNSYDMSDIDYDVKFIVTLPNKPISHNATSVSSDGKTLTWDLSNANEISNMEFEFSFQNNNFIIYLVIGVVGAIVIAGVIFIILKRKKNNSNINNSGNQNFGEPINQVNLASTVEQPINQINQASTVDQPINQINQAPIVEQPVNQVNQAPIVEQPINQINQAPIVEQPVNQINPTLIVEQPINQVNQAPIVEQPVNQVNQTPIVEQSSTIDINSMIEQSIDVSNVQNSQLQNNTTGNNDDTNIK